MLNVKVKVEFNTKLKVKTKVPLIRQRRRMEEWKYIRTHFYSDTKRR